MPDSKRQRVALVQYPAHQQYVVDSLRLAFQGVEGWNLTTTRSELQHGQVPDLQWSDYDEIDWDALQNGTLVNSYVIRKGSTTSDYSLIKAQADRCFLQSHPQESSRPHCRHVYLKASGFNPELRSTKNVLLQLVFSG